MDNQAFRQLLSTPRSERFPSSTPSRQSGGQTPKGDGSSAPKVKKPYRPKPAPKKEGEGKEQEGVPAYRDRAEERRRGINSDYESADRFTAALTGGVDVSQLTVEETKYLGGDMDHTHMVKGLDYALLHKVGICMEGKRLSVCILLHCHGAMHSVTRMPMHHMLTGAYSLGIRKGEHAHQKNIHY